jgi:transposase, IS30 family
MGAKKLQPEERDQIARLHSQGCGVREIARQLKRSASSISVEIKAGIWHDDNRHTSTYVAIHAQRLREDRAALSRKPHSLDDPRLQAYVRSKLQLGWSPEQIMGRLPLDYSDDPEMRVSHEPIYRFIYASGQAEEKLWEYLPRKQKKRRKQHGRTVHRSRIPDRVSIWQRSEVANDRSEFGHWEGDTIEGQRSVGDGIHTEVERLSRKLLARKVGRIASHETARAQLRMFQCLPAGARRSTTLDNGRENHQHGRLKRQLGIQSYFADPYSSWQRGTNENTNGLVRRYLPKQTDFTSLTQAELDDIVEEINNRPRKVLDYKTANEVYSEQIVKLTGVRIPARI